MLKNFRTYQLSVQFYHLAQNVKCASHLKDQLSRASASIALNLSEGSARQTMKDRRRFYNMAMGSLRECQTILDLALLDKDTEVFKIADRLGATMYRLLRNLRPTEQDLTNL